MSIDTSAHGYLDGQKIAAVDLAPLAFAGFAHFTAMQVRGGLVRGVDLHLDRLRAASTLLFGQAQPDERVRAYIGSAIAANAGDLSLTVTMFSRNGEFTSRGVADDPGVFISTSSPFSGPAGPLRLTPVTYERPLAAIKHTGEMAKTHYLRQAVAQGYDDAAFIDNRGCISEGTIWNLAFWDGEAVVWPEADMLSGVTMQIIQRQLQKSGVSQRSQPIKATDVQHFAGAAVMNSWTPGVAVSALGDAQIPISKRFIDLLHHAYGMEPALAF